MEMHSRNCIQRKQQKHNPSTLTEFQNCHLLFITILLLLAIADHE